MGSNPEWEGEAIDNKYPQHERNVDMYYMARYPVTVAQVQAYVDDSGQAPGGADSLRGLPNHPMVKVGWREALAYCASLTGKLREWGGTPQPLAGLLRDEDWRISLPSEAQWEKAARGADWRIYPWGDEPDPDRANYDETGIGATSSVGCFPDGAGPDGLLDMTGNVEEWCATKWQDSYKDYHDDNDPSGDDHRVVRGGSFNDYRRDVRCASRDGELPNVRDGYLGFRVCASPSLL